MEDFILQEIARGASLEQQLALNMARLNDDISTIFRQVALYRFEQHLHQLFRDKGYLSTAEIGQLFSTHMTQYMGPAVEQSVGSELWWVYISHIRSYFYVYSYASGLLISKALQHQVRQNPKRIQNVLTFLSAGTSQSPKDIFQALDIDITQPTFWQTGIDEIEALLNKCESLAQKLGKIN